MILILYPWRSRDHSGSDHCQTGRRGLSARHRGESQGRESHRKIRNVLDDNMAYIQIVEFDDVTIDQFTDALATVKGSEGLILDLRGNPGGSLDAVVKIARKAAPGRHDRIYHNTGKAHRVYL